MKSSNRRIGRIAAGVLLLSAAALFGWLLHGGQTIPVSEPSEPEMAATDTRPSAVNNRERSDDQPLSVTPIAGHATDLSVSLVPPDLTFEETPEGYVPRLQGAYARSEWGVPDVPELSTVIDGRDDLQAQIEIIDAVFRDVEDMEIAAALWQSLDVGQDGSTVQTSGRNPNPDIYGADAFWPTDLVTVDEARQRDRHLVRLGFNPVQYNPVTRTLRYYERINARVRFVPQATDGALEVTAANTPVPPADPCVCQSWDQDFVVPESPNGIASEFAVRRAGEEVDAIYRFTVTEPGVYRIRGSAMTAAGVPASALIGSQVRLFCGEREVALWTNTSGAMGANDWIMFYADGLDGFETDENVYWLGFGGTGLRMNSMSRPPYGDADVVTSHCKTVTYGTPDFFNFIVLPHEERFDHWYSGELLTLQGGPFYFVDDTIATDHAIPGQDATICIRAVGVSKADHETEVRLGGQLAATFSWEYISHLHRDGSLFEGSATFSSSLLSDTTTLRVENAVPTAPVLADQVFLDAIRVIYPRELYAVGDELQFGGEAGRHDYHVQGFSTSVGIWVFDITDPFEPTRITGHTVTSTPSDGFEVAFGTDEASLHTYHIARGSAIPYLTNIEKTPIRDLGSVDNRADWIVITSHAYRDSVYSLTTNRHVQGLNVFVAPIDDIYNEFSYGVRDSDAIRQFLGYAYHHWRAPAPRYVLIAGKATYDPRDYLGSGTPTVVPTHLGPTSEEFTGLDTWFTLVSGGDNLADMAIGRVPVTSDGQMQSVNNKIFAYEQISPTHPNRKKGTLVTGENRNFGDNFTASADQVAARMTANGFLTPQKLYDCDCNTTLLNAINLGGRFFVGYWGHGAANRWDTPSGGGANLLHETDVPTLSNSFWPIFTVYTCQNGFYLNPYQDSLAELLVERASHGGIAMIAPTGLSQAGLADFMSDGFYESLIDNETMRLGDAMLDSYLNLWIEKGNSSTELLFYQIFGDPSLIVNPQ